MHGYVKAPTARGGRNDTDQRQRAYRGAGISVEEAAGCWLGCSFTSILRLQPFPCLTLGQVKTEAPDTLHEIACRLCFPIPCYYKWVREHNSSTFRLASFHLASCFGELTKTVHKTSKGLVSAEEAGGAWQGYKLF